MASQVVPFTTVTVNPSAIAWAASTLELPPVTVSPLMSAVLGPPAAWAACGARITAQLKIATMATRHTRPTLCLRLARLGKRRCIRVRVIECRSRLWNIIPFLPSYPAHKPLSVATSRPESSRVACRLLPCSQCVKQPSVSSRSLVARRPQRRQTSSRSDATQLNQLGCDVRITLALQSDRPELCAYKGGRPRVGGLSPPWPTPSRVMKSAQRQRRPRCGGAGSGRVV